MRVAYLGPAGSFSEEAARCHAGPGAELVPFDGIAAVVAALGRGLVEQAVVPIENSVTGSVNPTVDALIHGDRPPQIVAELTLAIRHHLIGLPGTGLEQVERLLSHPQAVAQCQRFILRSLPSVQVLPAASTSAAVQSLVHGGNSAAIGSREAAERYGMALIAEDIQDMRENLTRFIVLSGSPASATGRDKTSVCCSIDEDVPGSLVAILSAFSERAINLRRVESRPTRRGLGSYFFLIDLEGHHTDPPVAEALRVASGRSRELWLLGSYPEAAGSR